MPTDFMNSIQQNNLDTWISEDFLNSNLTITEDKFENESLMELRILNEKLTTPT